jgi:phosphatidylserine/phosphatidylglycerophosphate/cardiolipin synthase-like enzyme/DNA/RNA endonuclease YhcR with UshA esterase domain
MRTIFRLLFVVVLFPVFLHAQIANHVVISEVFYLGSITTGTEFVELYNPTGSDIPLTNIVLQSGTAGTPGTNTGEWVVDLGSKTIKAYGFLLVGGSGVTPTPDALMPSGRELKNSGTRAGVRLYNTATSTTLDGVAWDPSATVGLEGTAFTAAGTTSSSPQSIERKALSSSTASSMIAGDASLGNGYDTNDNSVDFTVRVVPQPQNSASASEQPFSGPDTIPPGILALKTLSDTQLELTYNEPVDSVTSSTQSNYSINKGITVTAATRGSNIAKVVLTTSTLANDIYTLTIQNVKDTTGNAIVTPIQISFSYGTISIAQARVAGAGQAVRVQGSMSVGNEFGSPSFMQDTSGGIAVFNYNFSASAKAGDVWEVAGILQDFHGLLEINPLTDSVKISSGNLPPTPKTINSSQIGESYESMLVRLNKVKFLLTGNFGPATADSTYTVADATGSFVINIDKDSNIPGTPIPADSVNIVGVVTQFGSAYQVQPRSLADIGVIDPPPGQTWTDINVARSYSAGTPVRVRGIVTFDQPSKTTAKTIYIQDWTGGIALYDPSTDTLKIGDSVQVHGVVADFNGLAELKTIDTLTLFGRGLPLPAPKLVSIPQATETNESQLLTVHDVQFVESGTITSAAATFHVTDGVNQLAIRIPDNSLLAGQSIPVGALNIVGVLGQYLTAYQLTPRSPADFIALPGPQIVSQPLVTGLTDNSCTISWTTLLGGNSTLYYGSTQSLGDSLVDQTETTSHSFTVGGLRSGRIYYIRVVSSNATGVSSSALFPIVTTSSASSGEMDVYFNYPTDGTLGLLPQANGSTALVDKLLNRISAATKSIDLALYSFDDFGGNSAVIAGRVADSLISAKNRGVIVRMVFDNKSTTTPLGKLITAGVSVIKRTVPGTDNGIMHNKFFVFDGRDTTSATDDWVITGSWNVTNDGTVKDAQNAVFIQDQSLARIYELEFDEMFGSTTSVGNASAAKFGPYKQDNTPHLTYIAGTKVEVYFSPSDQTTSHIINALETADKSILFGVLAFTRTDIAGTLIARKDAGVGVHGLIDQQPSVLGTLQTAGVDALQAGHSVVTGLFHHKYAVVDAANDASDPLVITGSHNWSSAAENDNDENTLIIHSGPVARQYAQEFSQRYHESGGVGPVLGVERVSTIIPTSSSLSQNYPNPFNPTTNFEVRIARYGRVAVKVFDLLGREVATLMDGDKAPGVYTITWDASNLASGVYLCKMVSGSFFETRKLLLVR